MNLTEIKKLSPVEIVDNESCFFYQIVNDSGYININSEKNKNIIAVALLHEIGHAIHHLQDCECIANPNNFIKAEYHAEQFTMKHIKDNYKQIRVFVKHIRSSLFGKGMPHYGAARQIVKLKQWRHFLEIAQEDIKC